MSVAEAEGWTEGRGQVVKPEPAGGWTILVTVRPAGHVRSGLAERDSGFAQVSVSLPHPLSKSDAKERLVPQHGNGVSRSREFAYASQQFPAYCFSSEKTLVLISHFVDPSP